MRLFMRALWEGTLASVGFIFFYGTGIDTPTQGRAHKCLNSWQAKGFLFVGHYVTPLSTQWADEPPFSLHDSQEIHVSRISRYLVAKAFGNLES